MVTFRAADWKAMRSRYAETNQTEAYVALDRLHRDLEFYRWFRHLSTRLIYIKLAANFS